MRVLLVSANREHFPEPVFPLGASYVASEHRGSKIRRDTSETGTERMWTGTGTFLVICE